MRSSAKPQPLAIRFVRGVVSKGCVNLGREGIKRSAFSIMLVLMAEMPVLSDTPQFPCAVLTKYEAAILATNPRMPMRCVVFLQSAMQRNWSAISSCL